MKNSPNSAVSRAMVHAVNGAMDQSIGHIPEKPEAKNDSPLKSQEHYLQLMLAQERRLEQLDLENRKLLAERDILKAKYRAQLALVATLEWNSAADTSKVTRQGSREMPTALTADGFSTEMLPAIDPAELLPLEDDIVKPSVIARSYKRVGCSMKNSAVWCGKKIVAVLT